MPGRPSFTPTDEQRPTVRGMAGFRVPHDDIALVLRGSSPTFKWFRHELDVASLETNRCVAQVLFQQATTRANIAVTTLWLMARASWRENQVVEDATDGPHALLTIIGGIIDAARPLRPLLEGSP